MVAYAMKHRRAPTMRASAPREVSGGDGAWARRVSGQWTTLVAHDVRDALAGVLLNSTALLDSPALTDLPDAEREQLQMVVQSAAEIERLVNDLLDADQMARGAFRIECAPQEVWTLLGSARASFRSLAAGRDLDVHVELVGDPQPICADGGRLLQVLRNLGGNAIKFTPDGGSITFRGTEQNDCVRFSVTDTGCGIEPEDLQRIFDPHWRGNGNAPGVGLGLAIARGIVEAHGGRIWAESEPGVGSTFSFEIPRRNHNHARALHDCDVLR